MPLPQADPGTVAASLATPSRSEDPGRFVNTIALHSLAPQTQLWPCRAPCDHPGFTAARQAEDLFRGPWHSVKMSGQLFY
ncbi:MAG TPA: hypothetical protein VJ734_07535, partial [Nitrosospira sp.]|nr:hypothetical protein [Nitrosospira sp.]